MTRVGETLYVVRTRPCGCMVSSRPAKDQANVQAGATHAHPDKSVSTVLPLRVAATVPEWCAEHAAQRPMTRTKNEEAA